MRTATPQGFDPEHILPARYPEELRPYFRFWAARFHALISEYCKERRLREPTGAYTAWFNDNSHAPGSFCWCCDLFGIDPAIARSGVLANWRRLAK